MAKLEQIKKGTQTAKPRPVPELDLTSPSGRKLPY